MHNTLWGIKTHRNFFHHDLKKSDPTGHQMTVFHLTYCLFLRYLKKENEQNIAFLATGVIA